MLPELKKLVSIQVLGEHVCGSFSTINVEECNLLVSNYFMYIVIANINVL